MAPRGSLRQREKNAQKNQCFFERPNLGTQTWLAIIRQLVNTITLQIYLQCYKSGKMWCFNRNYGPYQLRLTWHLLSTLALYIQPRIRTPNRVVIGFKALQAGLLFLTQNPSLYLFDLIQSYSQWNLIAYMRLSRRQSCIPSCSVDGVTVTA